MAVCPSGWHLPSNAEWDILVNYAGGSSTAGRKLKAASGWSNNGNGTDEYGFSALPGGNGDSYGNFSNVGYDGLWWSATEDDASYAYSRYMNYDLDHVGCNHYRKSYKRSLRCLQD
jgi:uncharacterized protein (TIGR02145 family)